MKRRLFKEKAITGIGSRETPTQTLIQMQGIGKWCYHNNIYLYSGHAPKADASFELGAQEKCIVFLPWSGFNSNLFSRARKILLDTVSNIDSRASVNFFHPAPTHLLPAGRLLMERNYFQVMGESKSYPRSRAVVCWTKDGKASGGTGQALRIAKYHEVPILNMFHSEYSTAEKVIAVLTQILK